MLPRTRSSGTRAKHPGFLPRPSRGAAGRGVRECHCALTGAARAGLPQHAAAGPPLAGPATDDPLEAWTTAHATNAPGCDAAHCRSRLTDTSLAEEACLVAHPAAGRARRQGSGRPGPTGAGPRSGHRRGTGSTVRRSRAGMLRPCDGAMGRAHYYPRTLGGRRDAQRRGRSHDLRHWTPAGQRGGAAALTSSWSNGQTEGQVSKLKMLKRQTFGRRSCDLLRRRVLLAACTTLPVEEL